MYKCQLISNIKTLICEYNEIMDSCQPILDYLKFQYIDINEKYQKINSNITIKELEHDLDVIQEALFSINKQIYEINGNVTDLYPLMAVHEISQNSGLVFYMAAEKVSNNTSNVVINSTHVNKNINKNITSISPIIDKIYENSECCVSLKTDSLYFDMVAISNKISHDTCRGCGETVLLNKKGFQKLSYHRCFECFVPNKISSYTGVRIIQRGTLNRFILYEDIWDFSSPRFIMTYKGQKQMDAGLILTKFNDGVHNLVIRPDSLKYNKRVNF